MTIAELHGKLSASNKDGSFERMEDLLTSDVFGTMKYTGWEYGFIDWLLKSKRGHINSEIPTIQKYIIQSEIESIEYSFWPKLRNNREPDLAMCITKKNGTILIMLIEAKYFSGTSDWEDEASSEDLGLSGNQIADQIVGFNSMSIQEITNWFPNLKKGGNFKPNREIEKIHVFVTMHSCLPQYVYIETGKHISKSPTIPTYWLSWNSLAPCLKTVIDINGINELKYLLLSDLYKLLKRKNLTPFEGFRLSKWHSPISPSFWHEVFWSIEPISLGSYRNFYIG